MAKPVVAIIGKPNVGKSTFFNYLIGERKSIVEDTPGVTRDRVYGETTWRGKAFTVIDTGGIEFGAKDSITEQIKIQAEIAIDLADCIVFMTDVTSGVTSQDQDIALVLKKSKKPVILAVNKVDDFKRFENDVYEFYNLGFGDPTPVSSSHSKGIGDVLDKVYELLPDSDSQEDEDRIKVCLIGKPNVGKSSLVNKILGENRLIVSDVAGTTRDSIDSYFENDHGKYIFIDTAGLRRHSKIDENIEKYSVLRTELAIERSDVCLLMIDCMEGVTEQDAINEVSENNQLRVKTSVLNELLAEAIAMVQPPTDKGKRLKIYYMTQVATKPPTFAIFVNSKKLFHFSYERYIVNKIRETFGFKGTPIRMLTREKSDKNEEL